MTSNTMLMTLYTIGSDNDGMEWGIYNIIMTCHDSYSTCSLLLFLPFWGTCKHTLIDMIKTFKSAIHCATAEASRLLLCPRQDGRHYIVLCYYFIMKRHIHTWNAVWNYVYIYLIYSFLLYLPVLTLIFNDLIKWSCIGFESNICLHSANTGAVRKDFTNAK